MAVEIRVPTLGKSIVDAVVANWLKREGDPVSQGEALVELETDKVNVEVFAEQGGMLQKIGKQAGDVVSVGEVLGLIGESAVGVAADQAVIAAPTQSAPGPVSSAQPAQEVPEFESVRTPSGRLSSIDGYRAPSPLARRIAAEYNVDLSQVKGNSAHGRVTKDDVIDYLEQSKSGSLPALAPSPAPVPARPASPAPEVAPLFCQI